MFDVSKYDAKKLALEGVYYDFVDPTTKEIVKDEAGKTMRFRLLGPDSPQWKAVTHKQANAAMKAMSSKQANKWDNASGQDSMTIEGLTELEINQCVACCVGWENIELNGKPFEFSTENSRTLFTQYDLIREQIVAFIGNRLNFLDKPKTT